MEPPPSSDRRRGFRFLACFPGLVESQAAQTEKTTAMISDLSETGALVLLHGPDVTIGENLRLELHILIGSDEARYTTGRVVRVEPLPQTRATFWTHQAAIEFHEVLAFTTTELDSLEKRKAQLAKGR
jgi:hypothetical protein